MAQRCEKEMGPFHPYSCLVYSFVVVLVLVCPW